MMAEGQPLIYALYNIERKKYTYNRFSTAKTHILECLYLSVYKYNEIISFLYRLTRY